VIVELLQLPSCDFVHFDKRRFSLRNNRRQTAVLSGGNMGLKYKKAGSRSFLLL
jgi:hypothetical protein